VEAKSALITGLEEELSVYKATEDTNATLRGEVAQRFIAETGFKISEDAEEGMVTLKRSVGDKQITVVFANRPTEDDYDDSREGDAAESEEGNAKENESAEESEEAQGSLKRDHPFRVLIGKGLHKVHLNCVASSDGSFLISELNTGESSKTIPVQIGGWNEGLQLNLIKFVEPFGVTEKLSYFIHQWLDTKMHQDNTKILEEFLNFVKA